MPPETRRAAGWYDDEADAALLRYWDGAKWSPHTAPRPGLDAARDELAALFGGAIAGDSLAPDVAMTMRLRAPDEHTTVPLPDAPAPAPAPPPRRRNRRVGGRR
jgi:hypothetical protein